MAPSNYPDDPRFYLEREYKLRRERRPHYSLRAYARDLGLAASTLTEFLKLRQGFSHERIISVAKKIKLDAPNTKHFSDLVVSRFARKQEERRLADLRIRSRTQPSSARISLDAYETMADWAHYATLALLEINPSYSAPTEQAKALGHSLKKAKAVWARLVRLRLVVESDGVWKPSTDDSVAGDEAPSEAIRKHHAQLLRQAAAALEEQSYEEREFHSFIFGFKHEDLPLLKTELRESFTDSVGKVAAKSSADSLYCASFQLYRLSKGSL